MEIHKEHGATPLCALKPEVYPKVCADILKITTLHNSIQLMLVSITKKKKKCHTECSIVVTHSIN